MAPSGKRYAARTNIKLAFKLNVWLMDFKYTEVNRGTDAHASTILAILRCFYKAPMLPRLDWGEAIRPLLHCIKYRQQSFVGTTEVFYQDKNSGSSSLEVEEKVKKLEAPGYGTSRWVTDGSQQNLVFDPGISTSSMSSDQRLLYYNANSRSSSLQVEESDAGAFYYIIIFYLS